MKIKGTSIASLLAFLEAEYGATRTREFVSTLDPNLKKRCEGLILASAYYPVEELERLARSARTHFSGDETFFERSGAFNAAYGLTGVYQALLARKSPLDFVRAAERAWRQFIDEGGVEATQVGEGKIRVRVEGIEGSEVRCARVTGFMKKGLELAGAQGLSVAKAACTLGGARFCEWNVAWDVEASPRPQGYTTAIIRPPKI